MSPATAAVIFTPFNLLPKLVDDIAWRTAVFGLFLYALVRLQNFFLKNGTWSPEKKFLLLAVLAISEEYATGTMRATLSAVPRRLGFLAGEITVPDDFDHMGQDEIERQFGGGA